MKKTRPEVIARKYALALFQYATEKKCLDQTIHDMHLIHDELNKSGVYARIRQGLLDDHQMGQLFAAFQGKISQGLVQFYQLIVDNRRYTILPEIVLEFQRLCDGYHDLVRGVLITASEIDQEQVNKMQDIVTRKLGKKVIFQHQRDPKILGGVVAHVAGWTFDDSLKKHLNNLVQQLAN